MRRPQSSNRRSTAGSSLRKKRRLSLKSSRTAAASPLLSRSGGGPRRMKHSSTAVTQKHSPAASSTVSSPSAAYIRLPRNGVTNPASACIWFTTEFPRRMLSPESSCGTQACTVGDSKAPSTESTTSSAPAGRVPPRYRTAGTESSTAAPETASIAAISFRLSHLSASIPPKGESKMVGTMASASMPAKTAADPVSSSTYIESAIFRA